MSLFCLCVVEGAWKKSEKLLYEQKIQSIANHYNRGVKFFVDWLEPIMSTVPKESFVINILDSAESENCELFLLPDGWYCNGETNYLSFKERMSFLQDICNVFINDNYCINLYFGQSGTDPSEFFDVKLITKDLVEFLTKTVGTYGVDDGILISVDP